MIIPAFGAWSEKWTRDIYFSHIPTIFHNRIYFVDKPHSQGTQRDWFIEVWFERKPIPVWLMSQSFQTAGTSVTLSSLSPAWNNANNTVEGVGGGGSGGLQKLSGSTFSGTGGGGGEYRKIANFTDPGGATPMAIGQGGPATVSSTGAGAQALAGSDGTATTWNTSSLIANPGLAGAGGATPQNGGAGGSGGTGAAANNTGGRGGNTTGTGRATGGGGAGGPNGAGNTGVDISVNTTSDGGQGDGTSGGTGGTGGSSTPGNPGNPGTELGDSVHGCGGGGGDLVQNLNGAIVGGSGGLYGGGGGGVSGGGSGNDSSVKVTSGAGANGIIVLTWTSSGVVTKAPSGDITVMLLSMHRYRGEKY